MKYHLVVLGCQMNMADSERVRAVLDQEGYVYTENETEADILGILACSVRQKPIDKVYNKIWRWNRWKNHKNIITFASGCVLPADREKFLKMFDFVFPMSELHELPDFIKQYGVTTALSAGNMIRFPANENIHTFWDVKPSYSSNFEAFVPIQNGCDKFCSFCSVPYTRGREISRPSTEILKEVEQLILQDYKSITLLGQNVNSYGFDKPGQEIPFHELLEKIGELSIKFVDKKFWVYFTSPHPKDMKEDVFKVMSRYNCLAKQVHLPLQSGDNNVLIHMKRNHTLSQYEEVVSWIREHIPSTTLFTDIIVGFTGETEEQFQNTINAMNNFEFKMAYIAKYSPRPGALSYRWKDDVPDEIKKERHARLNEVLRKNASRYHANMKGAILDVLVTGKDKQGYLTGYTEGRATVRILTGDKDIIGEFKKVKIVSVSDFSVAGELVKEQIVYSA